MTHDATMLLSWVAIRIMCEHPGEVETDIDNTYVTRRNNLKSRKNC